MKSRSFSSHPTRPRLQRWIARRCPGVYTPNHLYPLRQWGRPEMSRYIYINWHRAGLVGLALEALHGPPPPVSDNWW